MSIEAVFQMNHGIDSLLNDELNTELIRMLKFVFPPSPNRSKTWTRKPRPESRYKFIVRREQQSILDIIHQARKLSFVIQHNIVSCQLLVTFAVSQSSSDDDSEVLGTRAFGLRRITGSECIVLIKTELITTGLLQSLLP